VCVPVCVCASVCASVLVCGMPLRLGVSSGSAALAGHSLAVTVMVVPSPSQSAQTNLKAPRVVKLIVRVPVIMGELETL
jgi:hypothetical protein